VDVDPAQMPYLTWSWKVAQLPGGGDFRKASTDDQAAQLLVAFTDRRVISYIWDTRAPKGAMESVELDSAAAHRGGGLRIRFRPGEPVDCGKPQRGGGLRAGVWQTGAARERPAHPDQLAAYRHGSRELLRRSGLSAALCNNK
jgi:hypothetical protein